MNNIYHKFIFFFFCLLYLHNKLCLGTNVGDDEDQITRVTHHKHLHTESCDVRYIYIYIYMNCNGGLDKSEVTLSVYFSEFLHLLEPCL